MKTDLHALFALCTAFIIAMTAILCSPARRTVSADEKITAVHYFGRYQDSTTNDLSPLVSTNINHVVLVPYAYQETYLDSELRTSSARRSQASRDSLYRVFNQQAKGRGLTVSLKPHIWMRTDLGKWRSDISFNDKELADAWADRYRQFILDHAKLSESIGAPIFCIGAELSNLTLNYPDYWRDLISMVRAVYSGKVYYAANWYEELEGITFWDELDYIGVQAYFPLTKKKNPTVSDLRSGWAPIKRKLKGISRKFDRPVLFSELGYRSTSCAGIDPWEWVDGPDAEQNFQLSLETQKACYQAAFETFWHESWFAGTLIWQWRANHRDAGGQTNLNFTPQNKPAQDVLAKWFAM